MTIAKIETQISEATRRANALERRLEGSNELEHGIDLQRELDSLTAYRERLQRQLAEAQQHEEAIQKEREQFALETELDSLRLAYHGNRSKAAEIVNTLTQTVVQAVPGLSELSGERTQLQNRYESAFRQRYGHELGFTNRLQAQGLEHTEFSDKMSALIWQITEELASRRMAERRRNGV